MGKNNKHRKMDEQLTKAICMNFKPGVKKKQLKPEERAYTITSRKSRSDLISFAKSFGKWEHHNHPEIRLAKDIPKEHVLEYCKEKGKTWRNRTRDEYESKFNKISAIINRAFGGSTDFSIKLERNHEESAIRNIAMSIKDFEKLNEQMHHSSSKAYLAADLSWHGGLRVNEAAHFRGSFIDLEKKELHLHKDAGTKNGRFRDVPFLPGDEEYEFWKGIKEKFGNELVCGGIKSDSINGQINRCLKKAGLGEKYTKQQCTSVHSIRKAWTQRWRSYLCGEKRMKTAEAWRMVSTYLGHGENRDALKKVYWDVAK